MCTVTGYHSHPYPCKLIFILFWYTLCYLAGKKLIVCPRIVLATVQVSGLCTQMRPSCVDEYEKMCCPPLSAVMQHRMMKEAQRAMAPWLGGQPVYGPMSHASSQMNPLLYPGTHTHTHTPTHDCRQVFIHLTLLCECFCPSRVRLRQEHPFEAHAPPPSSVLVLQHAPSQWPWQPHPCQHQSHA